MVTSKNYSIVPIGTLKTSEVFNITKRQIHSSESKAFLKSLDDESTLDSAIQLGNEHITNGKQSCLDLYKQLGKKMIWTKVQIKHIMNHIMNTIDPESPEGKKYRDGNWIILYHLNEKALRRVCFRWSSGGGGGFWFCDEFVAHSSYWDAGGQVLCDSEI